jgi:hypothetical protein
MIDAARLGGKPKSGKFTTCQEAFYPQITRKKARVYPIKSSQLEKNNDDRKKSCSAIPQLIKAKIVLVYCLALSC